MLILVNEMSFESSKIELHFLLFVKKISIKSSKFCRIKTSKEDKSNKEHMDFFILFFLGGGGVGFRNLASKNNILFSYSTHKDVYNKSNISSIRFHVHNLCHLEVDFPVFTTIIWPDVTLSHITRRKDPNNVMIMKKS